MRVLAILVASATFVSAHFQLNWPPARGYDEEMLAQYPCGGQNTVGSNRTQIPIGSSFPIQLHMGHTQANVEVILALGNSPSGDDFTNVLVPTFHEDGPQNFCIGGVTIPATLPGGSNSTIAPNTNGTIQVITNGDGQGESGLYNCADVTFTNTPLSPQDYNANCNNATGVHTEALPPNQASTNANGTAQGGSSTSSAGPSGSASAAAGAPSNSGAAKSAAAAVEPGTGSMNGVVAAVVVMAAVGFGFGMGL